MSLSIEDDIKMHKKWTAEGGQSKLVTFDFLTLKSWVWEIGGWKGDWVESIAKKYNPYITVFEPVPIWHSYMKERFSNNHKIRLENYGLGCLDRMINVGISEDASGMYDNNNQQRVQIKSIEKVMGECLEDTIDVMQCNCEGGEYEIFPKLIKTGLIQRFKLIIIQFHFLRDEHPKWRKEIQEGLAKTHKLVSCYDWKFEYWERM